MLADPAVRSHFGEGRSLVAATADAAGNPTCCRAVALIAGPGALRVTVYLPVATAAETVANLATTGQIAIVSSEVVSHRTVQLKGRSGTVRVAGEDERGVVRAWLEKFGEAVNALGLPRRIVESVSHWPAFAVEVEVEAVFDQTPGPRAGARQG